MKNILIYDPITSGKNPFPIQYELDKLGYKSEVFDYSQYFKRKTFLGKAISKFSHELKKNRINQDLIKKTKSNFDLFIVCYGKHIRAETIKEIKNNIPIIVNWNSDDLLNPLNNSSEILKSIPLYDIHFTPRIHLKDEYLSLGANKVIELDWYYRSGYLDKIESKNKLNAIYFAGNESLRRSKIISKIDYHKVIVSGSGWRSRKIKNLGYLGLEEMHTNFKNYLINLNILTKENNDTSNLRNFEIPAYMGFQISERTEKIQSLFDEDKEIVLFDSIDELNDKIEFYSRKESSRNRIIRNSHERLIKSDYSLSSRVKKILKEVDEL